MRVFVLGSTSLRIPYIARLVTRSSINKYNIIIFNIYLFCALYCKALKIQKLLFF